MSFDTHCTKICIITMMIRLALCAQDDSIGGKLMIWHMPCARPRHDQDKSCLVVTVEPYGCVALACPLLQNLSSAQCIVISGIQSQCDGHGGDHCTDLDY